MDEEQCNPDQRRSDLLMAGARDALHSTSRRCGVYRRGSIRGLAELKSKLPFCSRFCRLFVV